MVNFQDGVLLLVSGGDPFYEGVVPFYVVKIDQSVWLVDVLCRVNISPSLMQDNSI